MPSKDGSWQKPDEAGGSLQNAHLERQLAAVEIGFATGRGRPLDVRGKFLIERPVHLGNGRSLTSSRKSEFGDSSHSRVATGDRDKIAGERLHPKVANWRYRPQAEIQRVRFSSPKLTLRAKARAEQ